MQERARRVQERREELQDRQARIMILCTIAITFITSCDHLHDLLYMAQPRTLNLGNLAPCVALKGQAGADRVRGGEAYAG